LENTVVITDFNSLEYLSINLKLFNWITFDFRAESSYFLLGVLDFVTIKIK